MKRRRRAPLSFHHPAGSILRSSGRQAFQAGRAQPVQRLLERDVPVEIVTPMLAHAALALALYHPFEPQDDHGAGLRPCLERLGEVEMAGDLQRRHLPGLQSP
jgi:hypothetical protein